MSDKDLLSKIVKAVTSFIIEKLLNFDEILKNVAAAVLESEDYKGAVTKERQGIYDCLSFDIGDSQEHLPALIARFDHLQQFLTP